MGAENIGATRSTAGTHPTVNMSLDPDTSGTCSKATLVALAAIAVISVILIAAGSPLVGVAVLTIGSIITILVSRLLCVEQSGSSSSSLSSLWQRSFNLELDTNLSASSRAPGAPYGHRPPPRRSNSVGTLPSHKPGVGSGVIL